MNVPTSEEFQCGVVRCEQRSEHADLRLPPEAATWLTGDSFSSIVNIDFCKEHWLELEDAVQSGRYEDIPTIDPDACSLIGIGVLPTSLHDPFPVTKYEFWKQQRLKKGRKYRRQEDKSIYEVLDKYDSVAEDAGLSQRLVSLLVDDTDLSLGPAEEAKHLIEPRLNSMNGVCAEVIEHSRVDIVAEIGDSLAAGDIVWIGEDLFDELDTPHNMPIREPGQPGSDPEWDVKFHAEFDMKDVLGYSDYSVEKTFRIFVFDSLSTAGFIGMKNKYLEDSSAYLSSSSANIETSVPAVIYSDFVSLPLIESLPEFLSGESSFEELQEQRVEGLNEEVPLSKKSYEFLKSKASSLKI